MRRERTKAGEGMVIQCSDDAAPTTARVHRRVAHGSTCSTHTLLLDMLTRSHTNTNPARWRGSCRGGVVSNLRRRTSLQLILPPSLTQPRRAHTAARRLWGLLSRIESTSIPLTIPRAPHTPTQSPSPPHRSTSPLTFVQVVSRSVCL